MLANTASKDTGMGEPRTERKGECASPAPNGKAGADSVDFKNSIYAIAIESSLVGMSLMAGFLLFFNLNFLPAAFPGGEELRELPAF